MNTSEKRVSMHKLLWRLGALESKDQILKQYNVTSTKELSDAEIDEIIDRLKKGMANKINTTAEVRQWRSNALSLMNLCGVYVTNNDWNRVNSFMLDQRICGKLLYELDVTELKALCKKLRLIAEKKQARQRVDIINGISLN